MLPAAVTNANDANVCEFMTWIARTLSIVNDYRRNASTSISRDVYCYHEDDDEKFIRKEVLFF